MASNLLGLVGLALIIAAVGALAGLWWAVLAAGAVCVGVAYSLHTWDRPAVSRAASARTEPPEPRRPA